MPKRRPLEQSIAAAPCTINLASLRPRRRSDSGDLRPGARASNMHTIALQYSRLREDFWFSVKMDHLPSDLVLLIAHKLAVQDPLSLLQATGVLAPFYRTAADNPSVWKEAFYGSAKQSLEGSTYKAVDAEVILLGGYRRLLVARFCSTSIKSGREHFDEQDTYASNTPVCRLLSKLSWSYQGKILVLVRVHTMILLWGLSDREHRLPYLVRPRSYGGFIRLSLQLLSPSTDTLKEALRKSQEGVNWRSQTPTVELYYPSDWRQGTTKAVSSCLVINMTYTEFKRFIKLYSVPRAENVCECFIPDSDCQTCRQIPGAEFTGEFTWKVEQDP